MDRYAAFRALHASGCFILPNPWDVGGVRRLEAAGFKAIASSSSAAARALGRADYQITLDECLDHLRLLCGATHLPVNADFEGGFAVEPEGVADNVGRCIATGVAGLSIEDRDGNTALLDIGLSVERIAAARAAIDHSAKDVLLVARTEGFLTGQPDLGQTILRLNAYAAAGADVLFAPGIRDLASNAEVVKAVAPKPVNVLLSVTDCSVPELESIGVRRVSTGGGLSVASWAGFDAAVALLKSDGLLKPR